MRKPMQIEKYIGTIITIAVLGGGELIALGVYKAKFNMLEERVVKVENQGSIFTREALIALKTQVENLMEKQKLADAKQNGIEKSLNELNTSVKVIEAWVKTQIKDQKI